MSDSTPATGTNQGAALTDLAAEFRHVLRTHATSFPEPVVDALLPIVAARLADERARIAQAIERTPWEQASTERPPADGDEAVWMAGVDSACRFAARIAREGGEDS